MLEKNQPGSDSVLKFAQHKGLGALVNRPLNAFYNNQLIRLAQVPTTVRQSKDEIVRKIQFLTKSEKSLWMKFLPAISVPPGLRTRIKEQIAVGDILKHHWLNFGSYEHSRQVKAVICSPGSRGSWIFWNHSAAKVRIYQTG